jgi:hypothetical protein
MTAMELRMLVAFPILVPQHLWSLSPMAELFRHIRMEGVQTQRLHLPYLGTETASAQMAVFALSYILCERDISPQQSLCDC